MKMTKKWLILMCLPLAFIMLTINLSGQTGDKNSEIIPIDPKVKIGTLDNGMRYYIQKNSYPEKRAEFFLTVKAGALQEESHQDGLAHFCEHMCFNGTKHFKKHEIIEYLQSIGMKFGPEINAFTSREFTNYMLQKVPVEKEIIDTALLILYDWASNVSFEGEEIDNERGVIHEEWRTRRGAQFRLMNKTDKVIYQGSKYAERDVIGNIDIIDHCEYDALRSFYKEWYRPDLQAIIAVGDFEVDEMEKQIIELFSKIPKRENPKPRESYSIPDHDETLISIETDEEAQYSMVRLMYKHEPVKLEDKVKKEYLKSQIINELYGTMFRERMDELTRAANPTILYAYTYYGSIAETKDSYNVFAISKNNMIDETLKTVFIENERIKKHGFTETELERAKKNLIQQVESNYNERNKKESTDYNWKYMEHFLSNEPIPSIEYGFEFTKSIMEQITLSDVNALPAKWIQDKNRVIVITAPKKEDVLVPTKEKVLEVINTIDITTIEPYKDKVITKPLLNKEPIAAKVVKETYDEEIQTYIWQLANGAKVIIKPTDYKDDEILFTAFSKGGYSLYEAKDKINLDFMAQIISESGIGDFSYSELVKFLSDKNLEGHIYIDELEEGLRGQSSKKDFETFLQLMYLHFTQARKDQTAFDSYIAKVSSFIENRGLDPRTALQDTIMVTLNQYSPYHKPLSKEQMSEVNLDRVFEIYAERFRNAADFTFVFVGNIDLKSAKPLIEKYIGGIGSTESIEKFEDLNIRPPKGAIKKQVPRKMQVPKATVNLFFSNSFDMTPENQIALMAIDDILDLRYTETIREEEGGTYGVGVRIMQEKYPYPHYLLRISFDCAPENADKLKQIAIDEIKKLQTEGPVEKDLNSFKLNKLKEREEDLKDNRFWNNTLKRKFWYDTDNTLIVRYNDLINDLDAQTVQKIAQQYIQLDNCIEIIMLPEE